MKKIIQSVVLLMVVILVVWLMLQWRQTIHQQQLTIRQLQQQVAEYHQQLQQNDATIQQLQQTIAAEQQFREQLANQLAEAQHQQQLIEQHWQQYVNSIPTMSDQQVLHELEQNVGTGLVKYQLQEFSLSRLAAERTLAAFARCREVGLILQNERQATKLLKEDIGALTKINAALEEQVRLERISKLRANELLTDAMKQMSKTRRNSFVKGMGVGGAMAAIVILLLRR